MNLINQRLRLSSSLGDVQRPGRYTGSEFNAIQPDCDADFRFCLLFPDIYDIGISYHGFGILYHVLNRIEGVSCERAYLPWTDMQSLMQQTGTRLFAVESGSALGEFDALGITLQTELHYPGVVKALDLAGIPRQSAKRDKSHPFIIGGGPCAFHPEPVAPFFDAFLLGDGEKALPEMVALMRSAEFRNADRGEQWLQIARIKGVYVPGLYRSTTEEKTSRLIPTTHEVPGRIQARITHPLKSEFYPIRPIVPFVRGAHDRLTVEIMRGCTQGCRFCQAGMLHRPVRERSIEDIVDQVIAGIESTGWDEVSLLSLSTSDYSRLEDLLGTLASRLSGIHVSVAFPSLRPATFKETMAKIDLGGRKTGITFAIEAGSQRLRDVINKNLTEEELLEAVERAWRLGWKTVKLYFMVGLPTERLDDIDESARLLAKIQRMIPRRRELHVSVAPFIPKPHSIFAYEAFTDVGELNTRIRRLFSRIDRRWVKVSWHDPKTSLIEAVLARGDRRLADIVERIASEGSGMEGWSSQFDPERWFSALEDANYPWCTMLEPVNDIGSTPWNHLLKGVSKRFYREDRKAAYAAQSLADCRDGECYRCGLMKHCEAVLKPVSAEIPADDSNLDRRPAVENTVVGSNDNSGVRYRYRLAFTKLLSARWLGHNDLMTAVLRGLRRAGIPLKYSHGFNPRPRVSFPPALPLGVGADALEIEFETSEKLDLSVTLTRLREAFPLGQRPLTLKEVAEGRESAAGAVEKRVYRLRFNQEVKLIDPGSADENFLEMGVNVWKLVRRRTLWLGIGNGSPRVRDLTQLTMKMLRPMHVETDSDFAITSVTQVQIHC